MANMTAGSIVPDVLEVDVDDKETGNKIKKIIVQVPAPPYNNIVLKGCGARIPGYAAFSKVVEEYHLLDEVERIFGTSGGAIAGMLMALGFSYEEIEKILYETELTEFLEKSKPWDGTPEWLTTVWRSFAVVFKSDHALSSGQRFLEWLQHKIELKLGKKDATFADLAAKIKEEGPGSKFKDLHVVTTGLTNRVAECKVYSAAATPDVEIAKAVLASAAYPFVFKLVDIDGEKLSDGGLVDNLPARKTDKTEFLPKGYGFTASGTNPGTLCVMIEDRAAADQMLWNISEEDSGLDTPTGIGYAVMNALTEVDVKEIREARNVMMIDSLKITTLQFKITKEHKVVMVMEGINAIQEYLENHINESLSVKMFDAQIWFEEIDIDELKMIIRGYKKFRDDLIGNVEKSDDAENKIKLEQLILNIDLLNKIYKYRKKHEPDMSLYKHVDLISLDKSIRAEMLRNNLWFRRIDINHLKTIVNNYKEVRDILSDEMKKTDDQKTKNELEQLNLNIKLLENFDDYRRNMPESFTYKHVNLKPVRHHNKWWKKLEEELKGRLDDINAEMSRVSAEVASREKKLRNTFKFENKKNRQCDASLKALVGFKESLKLLGKEKRSLEMKLGREISEPKGDNNKKETKQNLYVEFLNKIKKYQNSKTLPPLFKKLIDNLNLNHPHFVFRSDSKADNIFFSFDLRDTLDLKIYLLCFGHYLMHIKNKEKNKFSFFKTNLNPTWEIYNDIMSIFGNNKFVLPSTFKEFSRFIGQDGLDMSVSFYRKREMKNYFKRLFSEPLKKNPEKNNEDDFFNHIFFRAPTFKTAPIFFKGPLAKSNSRHKTNKGDKVRQNCSL